MKGTFSFPTSGFGKNVIILGVDMSSSVHEFHVGEGLTQGLDDTTLAAEKKYSINLTESRKKFCLSLHYNKASSYLFVSAVEIHKFKAKDSKINAISLCLGNISKDVFVDNMKKTRFYGYFYDFLVDYDAIAVNDILDIHKYLMKKNNIK